MTKRNHSLALISIAFIVFYFMLMACKANAFSTPLNKQESFAQFIERVDSMQGIDARAALKELNQYYPKLNSLVLSEQLTLLRLLAEIHMDLAQHKQTKLYANQGLELAKNLTSPSLVLAELAYSRGYAVENLGDLNQAKKDYLMGLDVARSLDDQILVAMGLINLGAIYYQTNAFEHSLTMLNQALSIGLELDNLELMGYANAELGILYAKLGEFDKSIAFYLQSYDAYTQVGLHSLAINSLRNIAIHYAGGGDYEKAVAANAKIIKVANNAKTTINDEIMLSVYTGMAWAQIKKIEPDPESAYYYLEMAKNYLVNVEYPAAKLDYVLSRAYVLYSLKRYQQALDAAILAQEHLINHPAHLVAMANLDILSIKSDIHFALAQYQHAYKDQTDLINSYQEFIKTRNHNSIDNLRLKYESEQADLTKKILEKKVAVQELSLHDAQMKSRNQGWLLFFSALVAIALAIILFKLVRSQRLLYIAAHTDPLTVINNRGRIIELGETLIQRSHQDKSPNGILMIDIDHFKRINDHLGHQKGDRVLKQVVEIIVDNLRAIDLVGRYGGEEFLVVMPGTNELQASEIAERIRNAIEKYQWSIVEGVTISIGIATSDPYQTQQMSDIMKSADKRLYKAKQLGRNRVC